MPFGEGWMPPLVCCTCGKEAKGGDVFTMFPDKKVYCHNCAPKGPEPRPCPACKGSGEAAPGA